MHKKKNILEISKLFDKRDSAHTQYLLLFGLVFGFI